MTARKPANRRRCANCNEFFSATGYGSGSQKTCSVKCTRVRRNELTKARRHSLNPTKTCVICSKPFKTCDGWRGKVKTCSTGCSERLKNTHHKTACKNYRINHPRKDAEYYLKIRPSRLKETALATAAMQFVRNVEDTALMPSCVICNEQFQPKQHRLQYTLCGDSTCHRKYSQLLANKRWHGHALPEKSTGKFKIEYTEKQREAWRNYAQRARRENPEEQKRRSMQSHVKRTAALEFIKQLGVTL